MEYNLSLVYHCLVCGYGWFPPIYMAVRTFLVRTTAATQRWSHLRTLKVSKYIKHYVKPMLTNLVMVTRESYRPGIVILPVQHIMPSGSSEDTEKTNADKKRPKSCMQQKPQVQHHRLILSTYLSNSKYDTRIRYQEYMYCGMHTYLSYRYGT